MNSNTDSSFEAIYETVRSIPRGRVMSYGQVGDLCGESARTVGWALSTAPDGVPWHRVVGSDGSLRIGRRSPDLARLQRKLLESESVAVGDSGVDMSRSRA